MGLGSRCSWSFWIGSVRRGRRLIRKCVIYLSTFFGTGVRGEILKARNTTVGFKGSNNVLHYSS